MNFLKTFFILVFLSTTAIAQENITQDYPGLNRKDLNINSIMSSKQEMQKINKAFQMLKSGEEYIIEEAQSLKEEEPEADVSQEMLLIKEKSSIYLGSILYFSKKVWTVWVNGSAISYGNNSPTNEIFIKNINGKKVAIVWSLSPSKWQILMEKSLDENDLRVNKNNLIAVKFTLVNNQSYLLKENRIIEGKFSSEKQNQKP